MLPLPGVLQIWFDSLWTRPICRVLLILVLAEVMIVAGQVAWLLLITTRARVRERHRIRFRSEMQDFFFFTLDKPALIPEWVEKARSWPENVVRDYLEAFILRTTGEYRERVTELYRAMGFLKKDLAELSSRRWHRRMLALRRLLHVANAQEKEIILQRREDVYPVQVMAASILSRVCEADDLVVFLNGLHMPRRMMERPMYSLLKGLPLDRFSALMARFEEVRNPAVRRILLVLSATQDQVACRRWMGAAAADPEMEVRIGACVAAGLLPSEDSTRLLLGALHDRQWEVRAQAAKALGELKDPTTLDPLARLLRDSSFWVRQNAARALLDLGEQGLARLQSATQDGDRFAADTARQELERHDLAHRKGARREAAP